MGRKKGVLPLLRAPLPAANKAGGKRKARTTKNHQNKHMCREQKKSMALAPLVFPSVRKGRPAGHRSLGPLVPATGHAPTAFIVEILRVETTIPLLIVGILRIGGSLVSLLIPKVHEVTTNCTNFVRSDPSCFQTPHKFELTFVAKREEQIRSSQIRTQIRSPMKREKQATRVSAAIAKGKRAKSAAFKGKKMEMHVRKPILGGGAKMQTEVRKPCQA